MVMRRGVSTPSARLDSHLDSSLASMASRSGQDGLCNTPLQLIMRKKQAPSLSRIRILLWCCYGVGALLLVRIFVLQVVRGDDNPFRTGAGEIVRGELFAVDGPDERERVPIAVNEEYYLLFAEPNRIEDRVVTARSLSGIIGIPEEEIRATVADTNDVYVPLKHFVSEDERARILALSLPGINFSSELKRSYPSGEMFAPVTGFVGYNGDKRQGQYGLEAWYNEALASGSQSEPTRGTSIVISVNKTVQEKTCTLLRDGVLSSESQSGSILVLDPVTGFVKSLCVFPSYNPNEYGKADIALFVNQAIAGAYEPGSVFKPITVAAALDSGAITPTTAFVDTGSVKFGSFTIRNAEDKVYGGVTMTKVLEESINTGVIFAAQRMGQETFLRYTRQFGFGSKTGVDLRGEVAGDLRSLERNRDIYTATASFGQGITVTPIQIAQSYAALANGGFLVQPRLGYMFSDGNTETVIQESGSSTNVLGSQTSSVISAMLASVVVSGHSKRSSIPGYFVAGKTGTAQVVDPNARGYGSDTIHTFAGYFPLNKPRFVIVVKLDKPKKGRYAESTAVPVFRDLAQFLVQYYKIPPEKQE